MERSDRMTKELEAEIRKKAFAHDEGVSAAMGEELLAELDAERAAHAVTRDELNEARTLKMFLADKRDHFEWTDEERENVQAGSLLLTADFNADADMGTPLRWLVIESVEPLAAEDNGGKPGHVVVGRHVDDGSSAVWNLAYCNPQLLSRPSAVESLRLERAAHEATKAELLTLKSAMERFVSEIHARETRP